MCCSPLGQLLAAAASLVRTPHDLSQGWGTRTRPPAAAGRARAALCLRPPGVSRAAAAASPLRCSSSKSTGVGRMLLGSIVSGEDRTWGGARLHAFLRLIVVAPQQQACKHEGTLGVVHSLDRSCSSQAPSNVLEVAGAGASYCGDKQVRKRAHAHATVDREPCMAWRSKSCNVPGGTAQLQD